VDWTVRDLPGVSWALAGLRRHKWTAAGVWLALTAAAAAWVSCLPSLYQAEAVVLVESHRILERLVPASVDTDLAGRLERVRQRLLSSAELQAVIRRLNLYAGQRRAGVNEDSLAQHLRRSVAIVPADSRAGGRPGPIRITSQAPDADTAARVANHLAWRFIEETSQARRSSSGVATQFLSAHAASSKRELGLRETALREFRRRNSEELPEQAESLRANARRLRAELAALRDEIQALESENQALEQAGRTVLPAPATAVKPDRGSPEGVLTRSAAARRVQTEGLRKRLTALLAVYTPEHPDVRRLRAELAQAERLETEAIARALTDPQPNGLNHERSQTLPSQRATPARLGQIQLRLEALAARRIQAAAELGAIEQRLQRVPLRQQELAALTREQAFSSEQFRSLAARLQSAEMAAALERSYPSERVTLLERARPPEEPEGPRRWALLAAASLGGLLIGGLLALARTIDVSARSRPAPGVPAASEEDRPSYITA
jgi:uncharacterized protein involved in exopolysaccharide biosynthesis